MPTDAERNAAFYDELAPHYDAHLTSPYDVLARAAFQDLVARHVAAGEHAVRLRVRHGGGRARIRRTGDTGSWPTTIPPGWWANWNGVAGTKSPRAQFCLTPTDYAAFLKRWPEWPAPSAVVANFAVLNSIRDLRPLFETFAERLAPPGWVIVSILNPVHWTKLKEPRWWLNALQARGGPAVYLTEPYVSYLHFVRSLLQSAPQFHLTGRANAGNLVRYDESLPGKKQLWWGEADSQTGPGAQGFVEHAGTQGARPLCVSGLAERRLTPLVTPAKRLLLKLANYPRYGPVGMDDPQEAVEVWLRGPGEPRNVTRNNVIAALRPFTIGVMLERNDSPPREGQPFHLSHA